MQFTPTTKLKPALLIASPPARGVLQRACACGQHTNGGECESCRQKREGTLQRAAINSQPVNGVPPTVHEVLNSPGQPLDASTRNFMEPRFGHDFSRVRVHTDERAAQSARAVNARAYTVGQDVVFGKGQSPNGAGRSLLAHELAHVVQAGGPKVAQPVIAPARTFWEAEAEGAASAIEQHRPVTVSPGAPPAMRLKRDPRLEAVLEQVRLIPIIHTPQAKVKRILEATQGINLDDPDNGQPVLQAILSTLTTDRREVLAELFKQLQSKGAGAPTAAEVVTPPTAEQQARMERQMQMMQPGRRGPYGQLGPGVLAPELSQPGRALVPAVEALQNAFASGGAFGSALYAGLSQSLSPEQRRQFGERLLQSGATSLVTGPVFTAGAAVGIVQDAIEAVRGLYHLVVDFSEVVAGIKELLGVLFSPDGAEVARAMGLELGRSYAAKISGLLQEDLIGFNYNLGRFIGPTIVYTVLSLTGGGALIAEAIAARLMAILRPLLQRFPRLLRAAEVIAARFTTNAKPHSKPPVDPHVEQDVEQSFARTFDQKLHPAPPAEPGTGVVAAGLSQAEIAAARRLMGREMKSLQLLRQIWNDAAIPGERASLTAANSRTLFNNHRRRFWSRVRRNAAARQMFTDAGFIFPPGETTIPIFRDFTRRHGGISLDHIIRRTDNPMLALDADNLRLLAVGDNTMIENLPRASPALSDFARNAAPP